jgi:hypothetical protein
MNPRVEIERQRLRDELKSSVKNQNYVTTLGEYDQVTGLNQVVAQNGGVSFGQNFSNAAQLGQPMRFTKAGGQFAAIDNSQIPSSSGVLIYGFGGANFSFERGNFSDSVGGNNRDSTFISGGYVYFARSGIEFRKVR